MAAGLASHPVVSLSSMAGSTGVLDAQPNCYSCPRPLLPAKARSWPETKDVEELGAQIPEGQRMGPSLPGTNRCLHRVQPGLRGLDLGLMSSEHSRSHFSETAAPEVEHSTQDLAGSFKQPLFLRYLLVGRVSLLRPEAQGHFASVSCGHCARGLYCHVLGTQTLDSSAGFVDECS